MSSAKDEVAPRVSGRRDPQVDPDSVPAMPAVGGKGARSDESGVRDEVAPRAAKRDPRAETDSIPAMRAVVPPVADLPGDERDVDVDVAEERAPAEKPAAAVDPRLAEVEPLLDRTAWKELADKLGPPEKAGELTPALGLIYALARREAGGDEAARGATALAIASMAALLGVEPESATALVLAKRLLRQNPASWSTRPAPPVRASVIIALVAVALGVAAGSFLSLEAVHTFIKRF